VRFFEFIKHAIVLYLILFFTQAGNVLSANERYDFGSNCSQKLIPPYCQGLLSIASVVQERESIGEFKIRPFDFKIRAVILFKLAAYFLQDHKRSNLYDYVNHAGPAPPLLFF